MTEKKGISKALIGRLAIFATTLIWGSSFVILKGTLDSVGTMYILAFRFAGAALLMLFLGIKELKRLDLEYVKGGVMMGVCLLTGYIFQTYGLYHTTPGKNAFLTTTYCVLVPFLYWAIYKKRPNRYNVIAAFACIVGIGFVSLKRDLSVNLGDALTVASGAFYGLHIIITAHFSRDRNPVLLTMVQFAVGAAVAWCGALLFEEFPAGIPASAVWSIIYLCVMCTGVCFLLQTIGQKHTPPSSVAIILTLESVFGAIISAIFYGERLTARIVLGFALIFAAVLISETKLAFLRKREKLEEKTGVQ